MIIVIIKMDALPEKYLELKQTLLALIKPARKEKGCLGYNVFQNIETDNSLGLIEVWENRDNLDAHLRSDRFTVLIGATSLLR